MRFELSCLKKSATFPTGFIHEAGFFARLDLRQLSVVRTHYLSAVGRQLCTNEKTLRTTESVGNVVELPEPAQQRLVAGGQRNRLARSAVVYFDVTIRDKADRHADRQMLRVDLGLFSDSCSAVSSGSGGIFRLGWYSVQMDSVPIE